jgi:phage major head subunit gpT-like protein
MMTRESWGEMLLPGLRKIYDDHRRDLPDYTAQLFAVEGSKKAAEIHLGVGSLGTMDEWESTNKSVSYEDIDKGYPSTFTHKKYSKGVQIERELLDDEMYGEIRRRVKKLSNVAYYTRQQHGIGVFNNAFNAVYKGPDGKPLCDDAHPLGPNSSSTQDNKGTLELTAANVETTRTNMMGWKDDKGNLIDVMPDTIIVPPALRKAALVIADSDKEPDTTDNNVNIWKGSLKVIEVPFLTNAKAEGFTDFREVS